MEFFAQVVALDCAKALGHGVQLRGDIVYEGLNQRQTIIVGTA
jgi:TRAP-type mannitol/chloroaromatic compound transport system permease small subunit